MPADRRADSDGSPDEPATRPGSRHFVRGLRDSGWIEGRNVGSTPLGRGPMRSAAGRLGRTGRAAARRDLSQAPLRLLRRCSSATRTIPIVFVIVSDPVGAGLSQVCRSRAATSRASFSSRSRCGGKWLELLKEIAPRVDRAAMLVNPDTVPVAGQFPSAFRPLPARSACRVASRSCP